MKRLPLLSIIVPLALLLSSCSLHLGLGQILGSGGASSTTATKAVKATHTPPANPDALSIANGKYRPKNLTVKVGTTLTWSNADTVPQSVTSDAPGLFDSGPLAPGATFSHMFATAGTFPYHSTSTNTTFGSITVTP